MRHFFAKAMHAKTNNGRPEIIDANMLQAVSIAEKIAPYKVRCNHQWIRCWTKSYVAAVAWCGADGASSHRQRIIMITRSARNLMGLEPG